MGGGSRVSAIDDDDDDEEASSSSFSASPPPSVLESLDLFNEKAIERRRCERAYLGLLQSYERSAYATHAVARLKGILRSYKPGDWIECVGGTTKADYDVPETTTLLLVGPRSSGKSSLVNRISRLFEDDAPLPDRAQVSHNPEVSKGTCFLQEYMIPRNSKSFCIYDTRSLSLRPGENYKLLDRWMKKGVTHGEMIIRDSDDVVMRNSMKAMARQGRCCPCHRRTVNFVIFVIDAISVKDIEYMKMVVETFNYPLLSFKDNKPAVVFTHGDELSVNDRILVRSFLGEKLGIPPTTQIFDISDTTDNVSELALLEMLQYSIEQAERNLPFKQNYRLEKISWFWSMDIDILLLLEVFSIIFTIIIFLAILF